MDPNKVQNLAQWLSANQNYPIDQLKTSALSGGYTEEEFNAASQILQNSTTQNNSTQTSTENKNLEIPQNLNLNANSGFMDRFTRV